MFLLYILWIFWLIKSSYVQGGLHQLTGYEPRGKEFESLRARQIKKGSTYVDPFFLPDSLTNPVLQVHSISL